MHAVTAFRENSFSVCYNGCEVLRRIPSVQPTQNVKTKRPRNTIVFRIVFHVAVAQHVVIPTVPEYLHGDLRINIAQAPRFDIFNRISFAGDTLLSHERT